MSKQAPLRTGFTTGTAASAAAKAAVLALFTGSAPDYVDTPLPTGERFIVPIGRVEHENGAVRATVVKDAGDDPDVTHGKEIQAVARKAAGDERVRVRGGHGVGRATLPGLPIQVGRAAINPTPREQIHAAALEGLPHGASVEVTVEVPEGEELARKTMNPRLGITGGISILGTHGIVRPFSHDAWKATVAEALDVAKAAGLTKVVFATGRRTERLYLERHPDTDPLAVIQAADFFAFANREAARRGFTRIGWSVFFGKLCKQAQGKPSTHAKDHDLDFSRLAAVCAEAGSDDAMTRNILQANTARQVFEMLGSGRIRDRVLAALVLQASQAGTEFAGPGSVVRHTVFDFDSTLLAESPAHT